MRGPYSTRLHFDEVVHTAEFSRTECRAPRLETLAWRQRSDGSLADRLRIPHRSVGRADRVQQCDGPVAGDVALGVIHRRKQDRVRCIARPGIDYVLAYLDLR